MFWLEFFIVHFSCNRHRNNDLEKCNMVFPFFLLWPPFVNGFSPCTYHILLMKRFESYSQKLICTPSTSRTRALERLHECTMILNVLRASAILKHNATSIDPQGDKVSRLTHAYPHKPQRKVKVTTYNHQADSPLCVWPNVWSGDLQV